MSKENVKTNSEILIEKLNGLNTLNLKKVFKEIWYFDGKDNISSKTLKSDEQFIVEMYENENIPGYETSLDKKVYTRKELIQNMESRITDDVLEYMDFIDENSKPDMNLMFNYIDSLIKKQ